MSALSSYYISFNATDTLLYLKVEADVNYPMKLNLYNEDCNGGLIMTSLLETDSVGGQFLELYPTNLIENNTYMIEVVQNQQFNVGILNIFYVTQSNIEYLNPPNSCNNLIYNSGFEIPNGLLSQNLNLDKDINYSAGYLQNSTRITRGDYFSSFYGNAAYSPPNTKYGNNISSVNNSPGNDAYAGLFSVATGLNLSFWQNTVDYRQWICGQLITPMIPGENYIVSMYVHLSNIQGYNSGSLPPGIKFTQNPTTQNSMPSITAISADIQPTQIINSSNSWIKIQGLYKANGYKNYFTIANFTPDIQSYNYPGYNMSYFFVDSISVVSADSYCCNGLEIPDGWDTQDLLNYYGISSYVNGSTIEGVKLTMNGTFTVNDNLTLKKSLFIMGKDAKINVVDGKTLTIDSSQFKVCGDTMWDGIEVSQASTVVMDSSEIWDAKTGILFTKHTGFAITNSLFESNNYGLYFKGYIDDLGYFSSGTISGTTFKASHQLLYPYNTYLAEAGIFLDSVFVYDPSGFTIGDTLANDNFFIGPEVGANQPGLEYGIASRKASFNVVNNTFENFRNFTTDNDPYKTAIKVFGDFIKIDPLLTAIIPKVNIGYASLDGYEKNNFLTTTSAVTATNAVKVNFINNTINFINNTSSLNEIDYVIDMEGISRASSIYTITVNIKDNFIKGVVNGIRLMNSNIEHYDISNNTIELMDEPENTGIYMTHVSESDSRVISYNTISKTTMGMEIHYDVPNLHDNLINLNTTITNNKPNYGIYLEGMIKEPQLSIVDHNAVVGDNATTNTLVNGIAVESPDHKYPILCNNTSNTGIGMAFKNILVAGVSGSPWEIYSNAMDAYYCFVVADNSILGDIGSLSRASDNTYNSNINGEDTYVDNANGNLSTLFTRGGPSKNGYNILNSFYTININPNAGGNLYDCERYVPGPMGKLSNQAQNTITTDVPNFALKYTSDTLRWLAKFQYYSSILQDSIANKSVKTFKDSMELSPLGKLLAIEQRMYSNTNSIQKFSLSSIQSAIPQENLLKAVLQQKKSEKTQKWDTLPTIAKSILEPIAQACPFIDGPAVQLARAIIYRYTGQRYFNKCEGITPPIQKRLKKGLEQTKTFEGVVVYPNPTKNKVSVEINLENQKAANFKLFDLSSRLLLEQKLLNGKNLIQLRRLKEGMYIYRIKDSDGKELKTDKLIIQ